MIYLTSKIKIFPTAEQIEILTNLSERCRLMYNFALKDRLQNLEDRKTNPEIPVLTVYDQSKQIKILREKYPEYHWVTFRMLQNTLQSLDANIKSFFSKIKKGNTTARMPHYIRKNTFITLTSIADGFKVFPCKIRVTHFFNEIPLLFDIPEMYKFENVKQIEIKKENENFFVIVTYQKETPDYSDNNKYQAFDLGVCKHSAVNSDGKFRDFNLARPDRYWMPKIAELMSRRDHCKKGSRRWKKFHQLICKMKKKCANQLKDFQHKLSRKIIDNTKANTIIVGNIKVSEMVDGSKEYLAKSNTSLVGTGNIARFVNFLKYKAELAGKKVIEIDEKGTSEECCLCGVIHKMRLEKRILKCSCGNIIDRDRNAAVNILINYFKDADRNGCINEFLCKIRSGFNPA